MNTAKYMKRSSTMKQSLFKKFKKDIHNQLSRPASSKTFTVKINRNSIPNLSIANDCAVKNAVSLESSIDIKCYYDAVPYLNVKYLSPSSLFTVLWFLTA